jgi:hypothetical protein
MARDQQLPRRWSRAYATGTIATLITATLLVAGARAKDGDLLRPIGRSRPPDVKAALISPSERCRDGRFVDGPLSAVIRSTLQFPDAIVAPGLHLCVRNSGADARSTSLQAFAADIEDVEIGLCRSEEAAAGDTTCDPEQTGELTSFLRLAWRECDDRALVCADAAHTSPMDGGRVVLNRSVRPSETQRFAITLELARALTERESALVQTDRVRWDLVFVLERA